MGIVPIIEGSLSMDKSRKLMGASWLSFAVLLLAPLSFYGGIWLVKTLFWLGSIAGMSLLAAGIAEHHRGN